MAPSSVRDTALYDRIHKRIKRRLTSQGRGWSLYASAELVKTYKKEYSKKKPRSKKAYIGKKPKNSGITRWFKEEWISVCSLPKKVQCGRSDAKHLSYGEMKRKYPYCRPSKKVTSGTPKTYKSLSENSRKRMCSRKRKNPSRRSKRA